MAARDHSVLNRRAALIGSGSLALAVFVPIGQARAVGVPRDPPRFLTSVELTTLRALIHVR